MTNKKNAKWNLESYFPEFNGSEMIEFKKNLQNDIKSLTQTAVSLPALDKNNMDQWEDVVVKCEDILARFSHLSSYIGCLCANDAHNEDYQKEAAAESVLSADYDKIHIELLRAIKETPDELYDAFIQKASFDGMKYYLKRVREDAQKTMTTEKEILASDLNVDGFDAWGRLYDTIQGKLTFEMKWPDGKVERLPMSQRRSLLENPDRAVRSAAFEGGNKAWSAMEDVAAAALNSISGTRHTLNRHRGVNHFLDNALFQSGITRKTLDAIFQSIKENIEIPQKILKLKAKTQGTKAIAWYDLGSPLPLKDQEEISWEKGKGLVQQSFSTAYPRLGDYLKSMLDQNWIEWEPRAGKRPGAFCTGSLMTKESRVFMTFNKSLGDVLTLAHEVGHAFHSEVMKECRPYAHLYPMTLAETASTFGEMVLADGLLKDPHITDTQRAILLDMEIGHGSVYLMDIPVRFEFEKQFYEERKSGELSVSRFKELMAQTQRNIFGDVLEDGGEDPYFWASKLHFYITEVTFYNFPYTFGYLLSRGLYAMFKKEGSAFLPKYEAFLKMTGSDTAENVAKQTLGLDLETTAFWTQSIKSLEEPLAQFEEVLPKVLKI